MNLDQSLPAQVREFRAKVMLDTVIRAGSVCAAARVLKIHRNTIYRELKLNGTRLTVAKLRRVQMKLKLTAQCLDVQSHERIAVKEPSIGLFA